jgi:predicted transcriptional regulator
MGKNTTNSRQSGRGHSSIYDSVDMQVDLKHEADDSTGMVELNFVKNREGTTPKGINFRFYDDGYFNENQYCSEKLCFECLDENVEKNSKSSNLKFNILNSLCGNELNQRDLYKLIKGDSNIFYNNLKKFTEEGLISIRIGSKNSKNYSLTSDGLAFLHYNKGKNNE